MRKAVYAVGILLMLAFAGHQAWTYRLGREFDRRAAKVEQAADFKRPPVPRDQDVVAGLRDLEKWIAKHDEAFGHKAWDFYFDEAWDNPEFLDEEGLLLRRRYVKSVSGLIGRLEDVLQRPHYRTELNWVGPVDEMFAAELTAVQGVSKPLMVIARYSADQGDIVQVARLMVRLAERLETPTVLGYAVSTVPHDLAIDCVLLNRHRKDIDFARLREALDGPFREAEHTRPPAPALRQERALLLGWIEIWRTGRSVVPELIHDGRQRAFLRRAQLYKDAMLCLDLYERGIADCATTTAEQAMDVGARYMEGYRKDSNWPSEGVRAVIRNHFRIFARDVARLRLARVALALMEAHQKDGKWPEALVGPELLDPFTGEPFVYTTIDDMVWLFAVDRPDKHSPYDKGLMDLELGWEWPR